MNAELKQTEIANSVAVRANPPSPFGRVRNFVQNRFLLAHAYSIFIASYYVFSHERVFKSIFYFLVFPLFILTIDRQVIAWIKRSLIFRFAMIWLGYLSLTLIWSDDVELRNIEAVIRGFVWIGAFFVVTIVLSQQKQIFPVNLFVLVAFVATAAAVIAILQFYSAHEFPVHRLIGIGQLSGNSVASGIFYGIAALSTAFGLVAREEPAPVKILYGAMLAVLLAALALTGSRGPLLAVALAILTGLAAAGRWALLLAVLTAGLALVGFGAFTDMGSYDFLNRGSSLRFEIWSLTWERILDEFWFGHGIAADPSVTLANGYVFNSPHQLYLANHFYGGVPATVLLILVLTVAARAAYRQVRSSGEFVYAALLIFLVIVGMFDLNKTIKSVNLVWIYVWFPLVLLAGQEALMNERTIRRGQ